MVYCVWFDIGLLCRCIISRPVRYFPILYICVWGDIELIQVVVRCKSLYGEMPCNPYQQIHDKSDNEQNPMVCVVFYVLFVTQIGWLFELLFGWLLLLLRGLCDAG